MCNRITQFRSAAEYVGALGWETLAPAADRTSEPRYNVSPGAAPYVMHRLSGNQTRIQRVRWGCTVGGGRESRPVTSVPVDEAHADVNFARLWQKGRCVVPAEGWYEWQGDSPSGVAYHIRLPEDEPMFLAALTDLYAARERGADAGFVIITAEPGFGLVEVGDRRPVVLAPEDVPMWLDHSVDADAAHHIARELLLPPPAFQWYTVNPAVRDAQLDTADLLQPMEEPA